MLVRLGRLGVGVSLEVVGGRWVEVVVGVDVDVEFISAGEWWSCVFLGSAGRLELELGTGLLRWRWDGEVVGEVVRSG